MLFRSVGKEALSKTAPIFLKGSFSALLAGAVMRLCFQILPEAQNALFLFLFCAISFVVGVLIYVSLLWLFRESETRNFIRNLRR